MAIKQPKRPHDINQRAASTIALATGQVEEQPQIVPSHEPTREERHNAAVALGRIGGQSRAKNMTPEQRQEIARLAATARWKK